MDVRGRRSFDEKNIHQEVRNKQTHSEQKTKIELYFDDIFKKSE